MFVSTFDVVLDFSPIRTDAENVLWKKSLLNKLRRNIQWTQPECAFDFNSLNIFCSASYDPNITDTENILVK